jgi:hypothetical protein
MRFATGKGREPQLGQLWLQWPQFLSPQAQVSEQVFSAFAIGRMQLHVVWQVHAIALLHPMSHVE